MRLLLVLVCAVFAVACGDAGEMTARDAVDELTAAGLEAPDPRDVTDAECAEIGCLEAVETDAVTIYRWRESTQAAAHAQDLEQPAYKLNEFVLAFPVDTEADTSAYANALTAAFRQSEE